MSLISIVVARQALIEISAVALQTKVLDPHHMELSLPMRGSALTNAVHKRAHTHQAHACNSMQRVRQARPALGPIGVRPFQKPTGLADGLGVERLSLGTSCRFAPAGRVLIRLSIFLCAARARPLSEWGGTDVAGHKPRVGFPAAHRTCRVRLRHRSSYNTLHTRSPRAPYLVEL